MVYKSQDKCNLVIWRFHWMTTLCTDYMEHIDDGSVQIIHFQVFIGTCRLFYFAFYGWTSNIDALTKLQYALWNKGPYTTSIVSTYYSLCLLPSQNLFAGGFITLLCCNRAPVLNLCSLSVILHSQSYEHSASQWAVELVWLPSTTFHHNSCLPPGNSLQEGTLLSLCVCFKMNQTVVEHVMHWLLAWYVQPIQTSTFWEMTGI